MYAEPGSASSSSAAARAARAPHRVTGRRTSWLPITHGAREPPRKAASISGASRSARRVTLADLSPVDLVVMGCVAAGVDGARLGKGGGFADLEFALATAAGLIGPHTVCVTTVHELQVCAAGAIPLTGHDVRLDFIITPRRVIDCRRDGPRPAAGIRWEDLTEEKIAAIPLLAAQREAGKPG